MSTLRVLFLAANPHDTTRLAVGAEYREIHAKLRASSCGDRFELIYAPEFTAGELAGLLQRYAPDVVHFSGHGGDAGELLLPDAQGRATPLRPEALAALFGVLAREIPIRCVVLNACGTEVLARALAEHVDCVIGMPAALRDGAAIAFASTFHEAIGFGRDVAFAHRLACSGLALDDSAEADFPTLHCRESVDATTVRPARRARTPDDSGPRAARASPIGEPIALHLRFEARVPGGGLRTLRSHDAVAPDERVTLFVRATCDAYFSVLQFRADGSLEVLAPAAGVVARAIPAETEVRLPGPGASLCFDPPYGPEELFVIASTRPLEQADAALLAALRPSGGAASRSVLRERSRSVHLLKAPTSLDLAPTQGRAVVADDDESYTSLLGHGVAVYRFPLQSAP